MILFFDTETTGLIEPRLVQLGMILTTDDLEVVSECCITVVPAKPIEEGATKAHGKTNAYCLLHGIKLAPALGLFEAHNEKVELIVGHNLKYDLGVMNNEGAFTKPAKFFCTMEATTPICKLPHKNGNWNKRSGYKWPKLEEAYEYFFGKKITGAHNALVDCRATLEIYKNLKELEKFHKERLIQHKSQLHNPYDQKRIHFTLSFRSRDISR